MNPKQLTKNQVEAILKNAPIGTDKVKLLDGLILKGYDLEGTDSNAKRQQLTQQSVNQTEQTSSTFGERVKEDINKAGNTIVDTMQSNDGSAVSRGTKMAATAFNVIPQVAYEALPETARKGLDAVGETIGKGMSWLTDKISDNPNLQKWTMDHPQAYQQLTDALDTASSLGQISGDVLLADQSAKLLQKGVDVTKVGVNKVKEGINTATNQMEGSLTKVGDGINSSIANAPEKIMNKIARVSPKEAQTFKSMTGKDIGTYLKEKGNFNSPQKIVTTEAETFARTLADKEATLAKLPGNFKSGIVDDVLNSLKEKAISTSTKNVKAPYMNQVETWIKKAKTTGLDNAEINLVKKLFEREVKLGYNKLTDATGIKQATYLDDALRNFQDTTAANLGFTNIKELSKQIQTSKFIVDKLGAKLVSSDLLNGVSLTDYIVLSGGSPTSVAGFLAKKVFSNKGIQAKIAKMLSDGEVVAPVKANYSPQATNAIQSKNITNPISKSITQSKVKSVKNSLPKVKVAKTTETTLLSEAKKYPTKEAFVKAQGETIYHGTAGKFDMFDDTMKGSVTGAKSAHGATWFTNDPAVAKAYSIYAAESGPVNKLMKQHEILEKIAQKSGKNSDWLKVDKLTQQIDDLGGYDATFERRVNASVKEAVAKGDFYKVNAKGKTPQELSADGDIDSWLNLQVQKAKNLGKDGLIIENIDDAVGLYDKPSTHYAIFDAKNIKTKSQLEAIWKQANN